MPQLETEKVKSEDIRGHKTPFIFEKVNSLKQILKYRYLYSTCIDTGTGTYVQVQVHASCE